MVSSAGVLRLGAAGVTDVLRLALIDGKLLGSTEAAADRRDGGLEIGGLASAFPAIDGTRLILAGRIAVACGAGSDEEGFDGVLMLSFRGILIVPALCTTGVCACTGAGVGAGTGVGTGMGTDTGVGAGGGVGIGAKIGVGAGVATGIGAGNTGMGSAGVIGTGLGNIFCFFFCCISGSMEGDADVASSNFLFFDGFFSALGTGVGVGLAMLFMYARALVTGIGLNRFFRLEVAEVRL